ncbi:MAG: helix-turn-helix domain-containing protein [Firmicutes bacterium]|nr:helix-turn-helix domain-containing protein [Bacillota bacterium]
MDDDTFRKLCNLIKEGNEQSCEEMIKLFEPLIYKNCYINGKFSKDCYQELSIKLLKCINEFNFKDKNNVLKYLDLHS